MNFQTSGISWMRARIPRLLSRIAIAFYLGGGFPTFLGSALDRWEITPLGSLVSWVTWPLMIASYILSLTPSWSAGAVTIGPADAIVGPRAIKRADIASALLVERPLGNGVVPTVEIELRSGDRAAVSFADRAAARALVEALGFGPGGARATVSLATPTRRLLHPLLGVGAWILGAASTGAVAMALDVAVRSTRGPSNNVIGAAVLALWPFTVILLYALARRLARAPKVTIGEDGLRIAARSTRWVALRDVKTLGLSAPSTIAIERKDGRRETIGGVLLDGPRVAAVQELLAARHGAPQASPRLDYARGGASIGMWRERIRHALEHVDYRQAAAPVEDAGAIVRSPLASADERVGAALALRIAGEPPERIRVAAEAVVDDGVREALEAVADGDDVRLEKALARART